MHARRIYLLLMLMLAAGLCFPQSKNTDSLKAELNRLSSSGRTDFAADTTKAYLLWALSFNLAESNPDTVLLLAKQALAVSEKSRWLIGQIIAYHDLGRCSFNKGDYINAIPYYQHELDLCEKAGSMPEYKARRSKILLQKSKALGNLGVIFREQGNYLRALDNYFQALRIAEELNDKSGIATKFSHIGVLYEHQADYGKSLEYHAKALEIYKAIDSKRGLGITYGNMGTCYLHLGDRVKAVEYYQKSLEYNMAIKSLRDVSINYSNLGTVNVELRHYDQAEHYFRKSLAISQELKNAEAIGKLYGKMGNLFVQEKQFAKAETYLRRSDSVLTGLKVIDAMRDNNKSYCELYTQTGDYRQALEHYKAFIALKDSLNNEENTKQQVRAEMNFEFDKKEAIAKAEQEKREAVTLSESKKQQVIIYSVSGILLLVFCFALFAYRNYIQKQKINIEITRQKELIEEKQKEIVDSIIYARKIQRALITSEHYIEKSLARLKGMG